MRKIGKVKYNGKSTADLGVIVSGEAAFDAAAPDYTSYQIPGKNGDLMLSNNRYLNIDVTYPAFIPADFEEKVQAIRNWMRSARSYARIEDNYDLLHYRMGMGKDVLTFEPSAENVGSNMSLVFDCKPQRFLYSGEEAEEIGVWGPTQTDSGDIVTFEDDENGAFKSIAASITPTQDLHGYDYPWPAGGGVNLLPCGDAFNITRNGIVFTSNGNGTYTVKGTAEQTAAHKFPIAETVLPNEVYIHLGNNDINGDFSLSFFHNDTNIVYLAAVASTNRILRSTSLDNQTVNGLQLYVTKDATIDLTISPMIMTVSTATPFAPYSNICPITGRTEATVWRAGKNLFNYTTAQSGRGLTVSVSNDGVVTVSGIPNGTVAFVNNTNITDLLEDGATYTISQSPIFGPEIYMEIMAEKSEGGNAYLANTSSEGTAKTFVVDKSQYIKFYVYCVARKDYWGEESKTLSCTFQLEKGSTATSFAPYSGSSYPVSWQSEAGTVYGGSVDVVSGVLTVDKVGIVFNGSENWKPYGKEGYYLLLNTMKKSRNYEGAIICDKLPTFRSSYAQEYYDAAYGIAGWTGTTEPNNNYIYIKGGEIVATSAGTIKAWLAENPIQVVYALATPQTYQLSGQQIKTLLGLNNVWADSGTVTAEWGEDPFGLYNPTLFDALPLIKVKNPQNGCTVTVNGTTMTCSRGHTGMVTIDCELMDVSSGATNLNADWSKDFPKLSPGENSVAFSGADAVTIIPRWWEL